MEQQPNEQKNKLDEAFKKFAKAYHLSEEQGKELVQDFDKAIILNIIDKLIDRLDSEKQDQLKQKEFKNLEELAAFLKQDVPEDIIKEVADFAAKDVTKKFLERI
jgi:Mor family transcriptional regulator